MKVILSNDSELVDKVITELRNNGGYCPCQITHSVDTICMCKHFKEQVRPGDYCICGLYKKVKD